VKIGALAPWFGSKRTLAPRIVAELGPHSAYWEPFCGSCAVLLAKPTCRMETVNDLHGDLVNLARVVRDREMSLELYKHARFVFCSDEENADARAALFENECQIPNVERALNYLILSWQGRNGQAGLKLTESPHSLCVRWGNTGGAPATRWNGAVKSIASWHRRLCKVTVLRRDGIEVVENISDAAGTAIYVDPPYIVKSDSYLHDFSDTTHRRLAQSLSRFKKARVVVSYYDHPILSELYGDWNRVDCSRLKNLSNTNGPAKVAPEVLLINGPSFTEKAIATKGLF
jgi:DNA adenine methylase